MIWEYDTIYINTQEQVEDSLIDGSMHFDDSQVPGQAPEATQE